MEKNRKRASCFFRPSGIVIARHLRHLFVTGFVKNTYTTVINMIRITFTVLIFRVNVKEVILKVLPQIQRREWWQKLNLFISYGGNFWRCFVCLSFAPRALASKKMRACVTQDGTICAKNSPWNQSHYPRYPVTVSYPYYGSCLKACRINRRKESIIHLFVINNTCYYVNKTPMSDHWAAINATIAR